MKISTFTKLSLIALFCIAISQISQAKNRNMDEIASIAKQYLTTNAKAKGRNMPVPKMQLYGTTSTMHIAEPAKGDNDYLYIYGYDTGGFVLVTGDDRFKPVLAYSGVGKFQTDGSMPENVKNWIAMYVDEMKQAIDGKVEIGNEQAVTRSGDNLPASVPNFITTQWDQSSPYNDKCPLFVDKNARGMTGCVATAMAQILNYYKYPAVGKGYNSYKPNNFKDSLRLDFSKCTFDWANMRDTYGMTYNSTTKTWTNDYTDAQDSAVAQLMYACGVAVNMNYGVNASGANMKNVRPALRTFFGFDQSARYLSRYYSTDQWMSIIKTDLAQKHPILYTGSSSNTTDDPDNPVDSHAFILCGYDENDNVYVNWGWGGYCDGYWSLDAFTPAGYIFKYIHQMVCNIMPDQGANSQPAPKEIFFFYPPKSTAMKVKKGDKVDFSIDFDNSDYDTFNGTMAGLLYKDDKLYSVLNPQETTIKHDGYVDFPLKDLPTDLPEGSYQLYYAIKQSNAKNWQIITSSPSDTISDNYYNVKVFSDSILVTTPHFLVTPDNGYTDDFKPKIDVPLDIRLKFTVYQGYNSICLPMTLTLDELRKAYGESVQLYDVVSYNGKDTIYIKPTDTLFADHPYILYSDNFITLADFPNKRLTDGTSTVNKVLNNGATFCGCYNSQTSDKVLLISGSDFKYSKGYWFKAYIKLASYNSSQYYIGIDDASKIDCELLSVKQTHCIFKMKAQMDKKATINKYGVYVGLTDDKKQMWNPEADADSLCTMTALKPNTTYYARSYVNYTLNRVWYEKSGALSKFTTKDISVKIAAQATSATSISCQGSGDFGDETFDYYCYSVGGNGYSEGNATAFRLTPNTSYMMVCRAYMKDGYYKDDTVTVVTPALAISDLSASAITETTAQLSAKINVDDRENVFFMYSVDGDGLEDWRMVNATVKNGMMTCNLDGLQPQTKYKFKPDYSWYPPYSGNLGKFETLTTGINDLNADNYVVKLKRNPVKSVAELIFNSDKSTWNYCIYTSGGAMVKRGIVSTDSPYIDVSNMGKGLYELKLTSSNKTVLLKLTTAPK